MPPPAILPDGGRVETPAGAAPRGAPASLPRMTDASPGSFRTRAEQRPEGIVIVAEGELDLVGAPVLAASLPTSGAEPVTLDLAAVGFMDSSGLRALLEARQACLESGRPFRIARPSEAVQRVLELVDLTSTFEVVEAPGGVS
jgi:anti-sigma B factor antagonist